MSVIAGMQGHYRNVRETGDKFLCAKRREFYIVIKLTVSWKAEEMDKISERKRSVKHTFNCQKENRL